MLGIVGCSPLRHLAPDDQFLSSNEILWQDQGQDVSPLKGAESVVRQPTNTRLIGLRIPLVIHGLIRPEALDNALDRRKLKGKDPGGVLLWLSEGFGEPPVLFDAVAMERTGRNLESLSRRSGYLNAKCSTVVDSIAPQRVAVSYQINTGPLWKVASLDWALDGSGVDTTGLTNILGVRMGDAFDADLLEHGRSSLAKSLKSHGFAGLDETYITFEADTLKGHDHGVDLTLIIRPFRWEEGGAVIPHRRARFREVDWTYSDSIAGKFLRPEFMDHMIAIESGIRYNEKAIEETYRRLVELPGIARVEIPGTLRTGEGGEDYFDIQVKLIQKARFGLSTSLDFTRTDARYGPVAKLTWTDRNVSGRGDVFDCSVSGGITSTQPLSYANENLIPNSGTWSVEAHYSTLGIPPLPLSSLSPSNAARSDFTGLWSRESRPEYLRRSYGFKYGFHFIENQTRNSKVYVDLLEFTYTQITLMDDFEAWLTDEDNPFIQDRFKDYASVLSRIRWHSKWQSSPHLFGLIDSNVEWTGWGLEALADPLGLPQNDVGQWMLANVPFTQFVRWEGFWTWNALSDKSEDLSWHGRCMMGVGITGENYPLLPFDRAFYSGGVNGMRGWSARQLGPGLSPYYEGGEEAVVVKGLGDLKLECNVEVRQKITEALELAWFMDVGNVWILRNKQQGVPSEDVAFSWKSFGLSSGLGVRLDFDFFLLRLDGGLRLHDPGNLPGQRWVGDSKPQGAFHLGIGHPF